METCKINDEKICMVGRKCTICPVNVAGFRRKK